MNKLTKTIFSLACGTFVFTGASTQTFAQNDSAETGTEGMLCILDVNTGAGFLKLEIGPLFVQILSAVAPEYYAAVDAAETCEDGKDNDCNGEVDDDCPAPTPRFWGSSQACETCMEDKCSDRAKACVGDQACESLVGCVTESKCMEKFLGALSCICGEGLSLTQCQDAVIVPPYDGACAEEILSERSPDWGWGPGPGPGLQALNCMARNCKNDCAENFWDYEPES